VRNGTLKLDDFMEFSSEAVVNPDDLDSFSYDALNRLPQVIRTTAQGYTATYIYDAIGNIMSKNKNGAVTAYAYSSGKPHAVTHLNGVQKFVNDTNGSMTSRTEWSGPSTALRTGFGRRRGTSTTASRR
jgi:hypothetical protein